MNYLRRIGVSIPLLFSGVFLIRFWPFLLGKTLIFGDTFSYYVPGKLFTAGALREGMLPLWNPYILGGISWIGDLNQSLFSFSTALFTVFEPAFALNLTIFSHLAIGFSAMYWLGHHYTGRRFGGAIAGILWMFSGVVSTTMGNPSILQTLVWIPWVLVGAKLKDSKRGCILTVFAIVLGVLGGYPQLLPYGILFAITAQYISQESDPSFRPSAGGSGRALLRMTSQWVGILVVSLLLTSFVTVPFYHTLRDSTRVLQTARQSAEGTLHPIDLLSIWIPNVFIHERLGIKWGPQWNTMSHVVLFVPWIIWVSLRNQVRRRFSDPIFVFLIIWTISALLLSMTNMVALVPILKFARGPSHALSILTLTVPLLCAIVITKVKLVPVRTWQIRGTIVLVLLSVLAPVIGMSYFPQIWKAVDARTNSRLSQSPFHTLERDALISRNILMTLSVHILSTVCLFACLRRKQNRAFLLLLALQCHLATGSALFFAPRTVYPTWAEISEKRAEYLSLTGNARVFFTNGNSAYTDFASYTDALSVRAPFSDSFVDQEELRHFSHLRSMRETLTPNWNMVYGVHALNGYVSLVPKHIDTAFRPEFAEPLLNTLPTIAVDSSSLSDWEVAYVVVDPWYPQKVKFEAREKVGNFGRAEIYRFRQRD